jgi:Domain of unknown function (DUF4357)
MTETFGRTIQLFLVDGSPNGLIIASIHGWTGAVLVASQATFSTLTSRPEADRTGVYILYGPDPEDSLKMRAYIGEADSVRTRIVQSGNARGFWESAVVVTTSDDALTKGHVRYLEARLIEMALAAGRVNLDNGQEPSADKRRLPEADQANMEAFLANLKTILPVVGLDLLKPRPKAAIATGTPVAAQIANETKFTINHKSGVKAVAVEEDGEFIVLEGSQALRDTDYARNSYAKLKQDLIGKGVLKITSDPTRYEFSVSYAFSSPSAAGSVILDRNTNGRTRWFVQGTRQTYHDWQESNVS